MLQPQITKNDKLAQVLIALVSLVVFIAVVVLSKVKLDVDLGFDIHLFALANAIINSAVTVLLIVGFMAAKRRQFVLHKRVMLSAIILSVLFLVSYICHHLFAGSTKFGDINHDGLVSEAEKAASGNMRLIYFVILITHIPLAGLILPFILFTAYRALIAEWPAHRKLARITWPVWLYVSISGVLVYLMISPYY